MALDPARADFFTAMGEEFAHALTPPLPDTASIQDCCEPVWAVLGTDLTPDRLVGLDDTEIDRLAAEFAAYFEGPPPSPEQIRTAMEAILRRWPPGSLAENHGRE